MSDRPNIVLVHGAWADGSCWSGVIERLQADGFNVRAPQFPESSLDADVARLRQVLELQEGPTIVVAHSYGGQIITAGADAPNVVGLVYIAGFALDEGESVGALLADAPPSPALANMITDEHGFAWLAEDDFLKHFAADVEPTRARVMYAVQQPLTLSVFKDVMGAPAWKSHPTWFLVASTTRSSRRTLSGCSPGAWVRPRPSSPRAMSRWSRTLPRSPHSSRRPPRRSEQP